MQMRSKKVFLHVGHGKTGSSFLQNVFVLSRKNFLDEHIYYPNDTSRQGADLGVVTTGNARHSFENLANAREIIALIGDVDRSLLLSSEYLFPHFQNLLKTEESAKKLLEAINEVGVQEISVLLFIRDPISFAVSAWLQLIKSNRGQLDLVDFLSGVTAHYPSRVRRFIEICANYDFINLKVFNYSRTKQSQLGFVANWLDVDESKFVLPSNKFVNRSLTGAEAHVIRLLNSSGAHFKGHIGKELSASLPDVPASNVQFPLELQKEFLSSMRDDLDFVSSYVGSEHAYRDDFTEENQDVFRFSKDQLNVISEYLINDVISDVQFQEKQTLIKTRKAAIIQRDKLTTERDKLTAERDKLTAERDKLTAERDNLLAERIALKSELQEVKSHARLLFQKPIENLLIGLGCRFRISLSRLPFLSKRVAVKLENGAQKRRANCLGPIGTQDTESLPE